MLFLWVTTAINDKVIRAGIVGSEGIRPLDIMVLFISLVSVQIGSYGALLDLLFLGVSHYLIGCNGFISIPRFLGHEKGGLFWKKAFLPPLLIFLFDGYSGWERTPGANTYLI